MSASSCAIVRSAQPGVPMPVKLIPVRIRTRSLAVLFATASSALTSRSPDSVSALTDTRTFSVSRIVASCATLSGVLR